MTIRTLTIEELDQAGKLVAELYKEGGLPAQCVPDVFRATWTSVMTLGTGAILGMFVDNALVGVFGAVRYLDPSDGVLTASEFFWYVSKESRGKGGKELLKQFEKWATDAGAKRLIVAHLADVGADRLSTLYDKMGYKAIETHYIRGV